MNSLRIISVTVGAETAVIGANCSVSEGQTLSDSLQIPAFRFIADNGRRLLGANQQRKLELVRQIQGHCS